MVKKFEYSNWFTIIIKERFILCIKLSITKNLNKVANLGRRISCVCTSEKEILFEFLVYVKYT